MLPLASQRKNAILVPLLLIGAWLPSSVGWAWCGSSGCVIDDHTRSMWARTWNAQNSLNTPLNPYYIPRFPAGCDTAGYLGVSHCQNRESNGSLNCIGAAPYPAAAYAGFEPVKFERLGKVPNEMAIGAGAETPAAAAPVR